ncbi:MAG: ribonuclease H-like domain-containing protein [Clostridia bacterium]
MPDLLTKLRMLDAAPKKPAPTASSPTGGCYHKQAVFPLTTFCDRRHATPETLVSAFGCPFPPRVAPEDLLFLDTETTGLSGGAGTLAFEVGLGYFTQSGFVVEQLLMHDYPEEPELLRILASRMRQFTVLCTFNGRTFDVPLLRSRFLMNRMPDDCLPATHADVLHPARRLWKLRLKQCTLSRLEEQLLGVVREDDLPGALVPQTYFQYLKDRDFAPLERILEHNRQDVVSLAQLFYFLLKQVNKPEEITQGEDLLSLARTMEKRGDLQKAAKCYRLCARGDTRAQAFLALAATQKRQGNADAAFKLYQAMANRGDEPIFAYEALAKLCEHQRRDLEQALSYTRQALLLLSEPSLFRTEAVQQQQRALQYRYMRLRRKLAQAQINTL